MWTILWMIIKFDKKFRIFMDLNKNKLSFEKNSQTDQYTCIYIK